MDTDALEVLPAEQPEHMSLVSLIRQAIASGSLSVEASDNLLKISAKLNNKSKAELRRSAVLSSLTRQFDFLKVDSLKNNDELYLWYKPKMQDTYRPFDSSTSHEIVAQEYVHIGVDCTENEANEMRGVVKVKPLPHVNTLDDRLIKVSNSYFWDRKEGTLVTSMTSLYDYDYDGVFRELFDGAAGGEASPEVSIDDISISPTNVNSIYRYLNQHDGGFLPPTTLPTPEDFMPLSTDFESPEIYKNVGPIVAAKLANNIKHVLDVFWVWANNSSPDTMNDLLKVPVCLFLKELPKRFLIFDGDRRNGKSELSNSTPVLVREVNDSTSSIPRIYWKKHGDIVPGDEVLSWRGRFRKVVATVKHPAGAFYRLTLQDGRTIEAGEDHLWSVLPANRFSGRRPRVRDANGRTTNKRYTIPLKRYDPDMWEVKSTKELLVDYRGEDTITKEGWHKKNCKYYLPPIMPVSLPEQELPIDPYLLGIIIGDAHIAPAGNISITGQDPELIEAVTGADAIFDASRTKVDGPDNYRGSTYRFKKALVSLGLSGKRSFEKFIPEEYLIGSVEQRYALLRGILDTDGTISHSKTNAKNNQVEFSTSSKTLADQVRSLVFSLGGTATIHERMGRYTSSDGRHIETRNNYRLFIRSLENPFSLQRKAKFWKQPKRLGYVAITNIEYIGEESAQCIAIDGDEQTYLATRNYIPTHNTFITLLETILGGNNCTEIPMKSLIDPHKANDLIRSWANLPREDYDFDEKDMKEGVAFLKNVATHEPVSISNYYKQSSSRVTPRFLAAFPRNGTPDFGNVEGNAAVMIRMRAIRFENDLSAMDNSNTNFEKETFTPEFCSTFVEMILGMAKYYNEHIFDFSDTSAAFGATLQAITDPATYFLDKLSKWFDHVRSLDFVTSQAELYFKNQGFNWNGEVMRSIKAKIMKMQDTKVDYLGTDGKRCKCKKVPKNKKFPNRLKMFAEDAIYAVLNNKSPEEYRRSLNQSMSAMTPQQAYDKKVLSVIELLEEFDDDDMHAGAGSAVAAQNALEGK